MDYYNNYIKQCKDTKGGILKAYLMPFVEYDESVIKTSQMQLTAFPATTVYEFDCTGDFNQSSEEDNGAISWAQTVNLQLPKVYGNIDINGFIRNDWRVLILTNNNHLIIFGLFTGLVCSSSNNSGTSKAEFNGFDLVFTGKEENAAFLVGDLSDFFTIFNDGEVFNYDFNFDIIDYQ